MKKIPKIYYILASARIIKNRVVKNRPDFASAIAEQGHTIIIPKTIHKTLDILSEPPTSNLEALLALEDIEKVKNDCPDSIRIITPNWELTNAVNGENLDPENKKDELLATIATFLFETNNKKDVVIILTEDDSIIKKIKEITPKTTMMGANSIFF